jgi:hypothetical protein
MTTFNIMICGFADETESLSVTRLLEMSRFSTAKTDSIYI